MADVLLDQAPQAGIGDAWLVARDRFLDGLDDHEKSLFKEATIENLFYSASNTERDDRRSKTRTTTQAIQPLILAIEDYGKALDVYSNIAPLYLGPIWGSLRVVLALATVHGRFYERMIEVFGRIGDILPRFREYQRIFDGEKQQRFTQTLAAAYLDIIVLCTEFRDLLRNQQKSSIRRIFKPLSPGLNFHLEEAVKRFRQHRKDVDKEAEVCHMIEEKEAREMVIRNKAAADAREREFKQQVLISSLCKIDYEYKHRRMRRLRHEGTGSWVLSLPEYQNWQQENRSSVFCCYGIPGCGKSVLTSSLIDATSATTSSLVASYYCDYADKRTLEAVQVLASLCQQLLRSFNMVSATIFTRLESMLRNDRVPDVDDLHALLVLLIDARPAITIFLDGIDEAVDSERKIIIDLLKNLPFQCADAIIKIYIASREDVSYMTQSSVLPGFKIRIGASSIAGDIYNFVKYEIEDLIRRGDLVVGNSDLKDDMVTALAKGAQGMFLWVHFQLQDLCAAETDDELRRILQNLPRNLKETYQRLLNRIDQGQKRTFIRRIFDWVTCAKRPLTTAELREAIAFDITDEQYDSTKIPNDLRRLVRACGNLILIDEEGAHVQFAHYTVQQYLLDPSTTDFHVSRVEADFQLGLTCVTYLSFSDFNTQLTQHSDVVTGPVAAIEGIVRAQGVLSTNEYVSNVSKIMAKLRNRRSSRSGIEFGRYAQVPAAANRHTSSMEKYALLEYVVDHWLLHTTAFSPQLCTFGTQLESRIGVAKFRSLLFESKSFSFRPWDTDGKTCLPSRNLPYRSAVNFAIGNNHHALILEMCSSTDFQMHDYITSASIMFTPSGRLLWPDLSDPNARRLIPFTKTDLKDINPRSVDDSVLVAQVLKAARLGYHQILTLCFQQVEVFLKEGKLTRVFFGYVIVEAVEYNQKSTVDALVSLAKGRNVPVPWIIRKYDKGEYNARERASIIGNAELSIHLGLLGCPVSSSFISDILTTKETNALAEAFLSRNSPVIKSLISAVAPLSAYDQLESGISTAHLTMKLDSKEFCSLIRYYASVFAPHLFVFSGNQWPTKVEHDQLNAAVDFYLASSSVNLEGDMLNDPAVWWFYIDALGTLQSHRTRGLNTAGLYVPPSVSVESAGVSIPRQKYTSVRDQLINARNPSEPFSWFSTLEDLAGLSRLQWAILRDDKEAANRLIYSSKIDALNYQAPKLGYAAIHFAIITRDLDLMDNLISHDVDLDFRDAHHRTLSQFVYHEQPPIKSRVLLAIQAQVKTRSNLSRLKESSRNINATRKFDETGQDAVIQLLV